MSYLISLIGIAVWAVIVIYSEKIYQAFGAVPWAEAHLGTEGGSRLFYKLIGVAVIFVFFLYVSGILQNLAVSFLGPIFGVRQ